MNLNDSFYNKVEKKTKVDKDTIVGLAEKLQKNGLKNENTIRNPFLVRLRQNVFLYQ